MITHVAIQWKGVTYSLPKPARHCDVILVIHEATGDLDVLGHQGFLEEDGTFITRLQAGKKYFGAYKMVYSEDLW